MNNPINEIKAFAKQASGVTRAAVGRGVATGRSLLRETNQVSNSTRAAVARGYDTGHAILKDGSFTRAALQHAGIGALAGGALGAGASATTDDRHMSRDVAIGGVLGALGGAGYSLRGPGKSILRSMINPDAAMGAQSSVAGTFAMSNASAPRGWPMPPSSAAESSSGSSLAARMFNRHSIGGGSAVSRPMAGARLGVLPSRYANVGSGPSAIGSGSKFVPDLAHRMFGH